MKCAKCGFHNTTIGQPKKINEKKLLKLRAQGMSIRQIAQALGASSSGTADALKRLLGPKSTGK